MKKIVSLAFLTLTLSAAAHADKTPNVSINDISTKDDTSIVIKKGDVHNNDRDFEIVEGSDEVYGDPENERPKAYANWKSSCSEWKGSMREMNKENQVITLNCNSPTMNKEGYTFAYKSLGSYKLRTRIREKK